MEPCKKWIFGMKLRPFSNSPRTEASGTSASVLSDQLLSCPLRLVWHMSILCFHVGEGGVTCLLLVEFL